MSAQFQSVRPAVGPGHNSRFVRPVRVRPRLLHPAADHPAARARPACSSTGRMRTPSASRWMHGVATPQEWADAVSARPPPFLVRMLFAARELLVRGVGIERGGRHVFDKGLPHRPRGAAGRRPGPPEVPCFGAGRRRSGCRQHGRRAAHPPRSGVLRTRPPAPLDRRARHADPRRPGDGGVVMNPVNIVLAAPARLLLPPACLFGWYPYVASFLIGGSGAENFPLGPITATLIVVSCQGRKGATCVGAPAPDLGGGTALVPAGAARSCRIAAAFRARRTTGSVLRSPRATSSLTGPGAGHVRHDAHLRRLSARRPGGRRTPHRC